ncbi:hypothetical protein BU011_05605 [Mammaliicoccus sciuri]|nr:hypothetical protein [Mammaliicoccus sciuri]RIN88653.1 hypothetical protein BU011_05605 [Mammaliicoccus sciuri]
MNLTKTTFGAFALTTTILLGACGNNDMHKDDKMDTKTEMKDKDMSKENMKDMIMSGMFESMNGEKVDYDKVEQTFDLKDMDTSKYNEVTIYCDKAHVVFGSAKLGSVK